LKKAPVEQPEKVIKGSGRDCAAKHPLDLAEIGTGGDLRIVFP
jgi:hypothetical protein